VNGHSLHRMWSPNIVLHLHRRGAKDDSGWQCDGNIVIKKYIFLYLDLSQIFLLKDTDWQGLIREKGDRNVLLRVEFPVPREINTLNFTFTTLHACVFEGWLCLCKVKPRILPVREALIPQQFKARSYIHPSQRQPPRSIDMNPLFSWQQLYTRNKFWTPCTITPPSDRLRQLVLVWMDYVKICTYVS
jgi:hypothetical protein